MAPAWSDGQCILVLECHFQKGLFFMNYFDKNAVYEFWKIHSSERNEKKLHQKLFRNFSMSVFSDKFYFWE